MDDLDRTMFQNFSSAANSLSQLYAMGQDQQKLGFQAGEQHGLEKLRHWILERQGEGSRVTEADVVAYLQHELDYGGEDASMPLTSHFEQSANTNAHLLVRTSTVPMAHGADQTKISVFPIAQPSPVRGSPFFVAQGGFFGGSSPQVSHSNYNEMNSGSALPQAFTQQYHMTQEVGSPDSLMDMNTEGHPQ